MTITERLATIRARCVLISQQDYRPDTSLPAGLPSVTVAMALTCIATIDALRDMGESDAEILSANILAAWK